MTDHEFDGLKGEFARHAREFLERIDAGDDEAAEKVLDEIAKLRERSLFQELGKLTREFHEALNSFRLDSRIANLAENEIPDARERLNYVIAMTEQAADRTLTAVEESVPLCEQLEEKGTELKAAWDRFVARDMDAREFRKLSGELNTFLAALPENTDRIKGNLNDVLLAQDFQDLTGQIIRRVITLVEDLEKSLVELIRISGQNLIPPGHEGDGRKEQQRKEEDKIAAAGPVVPGVDKDDRVSGQDEVDDLLSSLGF